LVERDYFDTRPDTEFKIHRVTWLRVMRLALDEVKESKKLWPEEEAAVRCEARLSVYQAGGLLRTSTRPTLFSSSPSSSSSARLYEHLP